MILAQAVDAVLELQKALPHDADAIKWFGWSVLALTIVVTAGFAVILKLLYAALTVLRQLFEKIMTRYDNELNQHREDSKQRLQEQQKDRAAFMQSTQDITTALIKGDERNEQNHKITHAHLMQLTEEFRKRQRKEGGTSG